MNELNREPVDQVKLTEDINNLFDAIDNVNLSDNDFFEINYDLLPIMLTEFLCSDKFAELPKDRKRSLIKQHESLTFFLDRCLEFGKKYYGFVKLENIKATFCNRSFHTA